MTTGRLGWDAYFSVPLVIDEDGNEFPLWQIWKIIGASITENAAEERLEIDVRGGGGSGGDGPTLDNSGTGTLNNIASDVSGVPAKTLRFLGVAPSVSGIVGGTDGRRVVLFASGGPIELTHEGAGSTTSNRIVTSSTSPITVPKDAAALLEYDSTASRWRLVDVGMTVGGSDRSVLFNNLGAIDGSVVASIASDGSLVLKSSPTRVAPSTGLFRVTRNFVFTAKNQAEDQDLRVLSALSYSSTKNLLMLASDGTTGNAAYTGLDVSVKEAIDVKVGTISGGVYPVGAHFVAPGSLAGGGASAKYIQFFPNIALAPDGTIGGTTDAFNGALGLWYQRAMVTLPSAAPPSGYYDRANPTTFRPECIIPGDNPTTGWRQYLAESIVGQSLKIPQVKSDESGYQFVSPIVLPSAAVSSILTLGTSGTITALDPTGRTVGDVPQVVDIGGGVLRVQWGAQSGSGFTAGGDLSGTSTSQTVSKIQGVAISGTPANGYFLRATGSSAATWQSVTIPTSAGGSGQLNVADGSGGWQTAPNVTASTDNVSIGGTPATSGVGLRIPKVGGVYFRNSANSGNLPLITVDGFDQPNIGSTTAGGNTFVLSQTGIYFQLGAGPATPLAISPTFVQFGKPVSGYASSNTPFSFKDALIDLTGLTTKTLSAAEYVCPRLYVTRGTGTTCEIVLPNSFNGAVWVVTVDNAIAGLEVKFTHTTGGAGATVSTGQTRLLVFDTLQSKYVLANP